MKVECPVCGRMGILQVRGNSQRVGHYVGYRGKTSIIEWHLVKSDGKDGKVEMVKEKPYSEFFSQEQPDNQPLEKLATTCGLERRSRKPQVAGSMPARGSASNGIRFIL